MAHYDFTQIDLRQLAQTLLGEGKRSGRAVLFHSPLRPGDDHPSFAVYANGFKDFGGSGDHGDCIDFVEIVLQCNRAAAIEYLIQVSGGKAPSRPIFTPLPTPLSEHEPPSADWQAAARSAADKAAAYLWSDRPDARRVLDYLRHVRHLNDQTIRAAGLGFNPSWCKTTWLNPDTRKKAQLPPGITIPYQSDGVLWAIRVRSIVGSFAAHLHQRDQQIGGKPAPKYLNLTGSHASGVLYNADQVTPGAALLLVEGEFDALLASQELSANGVTFGAASTAPAVIPSRWRSVCKLRGVDQKRNLITIEGT